MLHDYDNYDNTIIEVNDNEWQMIRFALEKLVDRNAKIKFDDVDAKSVLYLINEAFTITEEYRLKENKDYIPLHIRCAKEAKEPFVSEAKVFS